MDEIEQLKTKIKENEKIIEELKQKLETQNTENELIKQKIGELEVDIKEEQELSDTQNVEVIKEKKFSRPIVISMLVLLVLAVFTIGAVVIYTGTTNIDIKETFNTTNTSMTFTTAFPGENTTANVSVFNNATNARLRANLSWKESSNINGVLYNISIVNDTNGGILTSDFYVNAQSTETRTIVWSMESDSPIGTVTGIHNVTRISVG